LALPREVRDTVDLVGVVHGEHELVGIPVAREVHDMTAAMHDPVLGLPAQE
jgi:hypothetical protein